MSWLNEIAKLKKKTETETIPVYGSFENRIPNNPNGASHVYATPEMNKGFKLYFQYNLVLAGLRDPTLKEAEDEGFTLYHQVDEKEVLITKKMLINN